MSLGIGKPEQPPPGDQEKLEKKAGLAVSRRTVTGPGDSAGALPQLAPFKTLRQAEASGAWDGS